MTGTRQIVVVDVETTGLDPAKHVVVEVAWWNLTNSQRGEYVPEHDAHKVLATADLDALRINRYVDRLASAPRSAQGPSQLWAQLDGNVLAGSNPAFDAAFLRAMYSKLNLSGHRAGEAPAWHHRLLDLSAYAAGHLGLPPDQLPGLSTVCQHLGVDLVNAHTAAGDVTATGECFQKLFVRESVHATP